MGVVDQPIAGETAQAVPVVLINLDRSTDRLARMQAEFDRVRVGFERFAAVNGTDLPENVKPYFCDASGRIVSTLRAGEIGCYASHLAIWQRIAEGRCGPAVLVCEDDLRLPDDLAGLLRRVLAAAPEGWDIIRLSSRPTRATAILKPVDTNHNLVRFSHEPRGSGAQLVSRGAIAKLLRPGVRHMAIDGAFMRPWLFDLDVYGLSPAPIVQNQAPSMILQMGGRQHDDLHWTLRILYRWFSADRLRRPVHNLRKMGLRRWLGCLAVNAGLRWTSGA